MHILTNRNNCKKIMVSPPHKWTVVGGGWVGCKGGTSKGGSC